MKILHYIQSHKLIVASALLIVILGASSAIAYSFMNKQPVASVSEVKTDTNKQEVKQPETKKVEEVATEPAIQEPATQTNQSQPETSEPAAPMTTEEIYSHYGIEEKNFTYVTTMTTTSAMQYVNHQFPIECAQSPLVRIGCFNDYAINTYGSWDAAIDQYKTHNRHW